MYWLNSDAISTIPSINIRIDRYLLDTITYVSIGNEIELSSTSRAIISWLSFLLSF